jgi:hypothetical protein
MEKARKRIALWSPQKDKSPTEIFLILAFEGN